MTSGGPGRAEAVAAAAPPPSAVAPHPPATGRFQPSPRVPARAPAPGPTMGLTVSALFSRIFGKKQMRILMGEADRARGPDGAPAPPQPSRPRVPPAPLTWYPDPETPHRPSLWGCARVQAGICGVRPGPGTRSWGLGGVTLPPPQPGC